MELFDYLSVMISVILGLGVGRAMLGLSHEIRRGRGQGGYWLHVSWLLVLTLFHFELWWAFWSLRSGVDWNHLRFLHLLAGPTLLFLTTSVLVPAEDTSDLKAFYYRIRRKFFALFLVFTLWVASSVPLLTGGLSPSFRYQVPLILSVAAGLLWKSERLHVAINILNWLLFAAVIGFARFLPVPA